MQYLIKGKTLRENIVINKATSANSFTFNLSVKNLTAVKKDNTIEFLDKKTQNEVFSIVPPVMYDANGESSEDIQIDVKENKKGYTLILTPNKTWMNSTDRKYPIVIDPDVTSTLSQKDIDDTFICSNDTENKKYNLFLRVGNVPTIGTTETYLKFNNLPKLNTGDMVTNCQLYLDKQSSYSGSDGEIEAHKILTNWNNDSISWSNKPGVESKITDTQKVSGDWYSWDITNIAKAWYNNEANYGVMLKRSNPASGHTAFLSSDTSSAYSGGWPRVVVSYTNNSGLEDYWTYHSQGAGRAGTGYINDYNGNLIFEHDDMDTTGNRMPVAIKHIYNSNDRDSTFGCGNGWRTNLNQRILNQSIGGTQYYVYIDEDGTKHYFYYDSTSKVYKNEEGLDLTFKINSDSTYDIVDKDGTDLYFTSGGYLNKIIDKNGNTDVIRYNGTTLYEVTDGAGRVTSFTATAQGYLTGITDPDGRKTQFIYTGTDLTNIIYPDGNKTTYTYDSNHNLISAANYDGLKLTYSYYTVAPYRVKQVTQTGADGTGGGSLSISYGFNDTSFTDAKNRTEIYQFNNSGNTMCITDGDGNAQAYQYTTDNAKSTNKLSLDSKLQKSNKSYLKNSSAEVSNSYWTFGYTGASAVGSGSYSNEAAYVGSNSLKIAKTDYGDTVYYNENVDLTKGKTYTFSGYVKANGITNDKKAGAALYVIYQDKNGVQQSAASSYVTGTADWERYSVTFTLPADSASTTVSVRAGVVLEKGTAYFDALQLEEGTLESRYNLLENSDFDYGSLSSENWLYNMGDSTGGVTTLENRSIYKIQGNLGKSKNISQVVNVSGKAGDSFVLSGWAKADSLPKDSSANRYFALDLGINLNDGTTQWVVINFNADSGKWQFASGPAVAKGDYKSLTYYALYYDEENCAYFDNLQLYKEEYGQSYQYDSKGNVISTSDLAKQQSKFDYNGNNDLVTATDPSGNQYKYEYDGKRNITKATTAMNVVYSFQYDSYGNPIKSTTSGTTNHIDSSAAYTSDGNYMSSLTDAMGNTKNYNYDSKTGNLLTSTDVKGKVTTNTYDSNDRLTSVTKNVDGKNIANTYTYKNDKIDTIGHNGFNYSFLYDSIGRNTGVSVGNQKLITNIYEQNGDNLLESDYGNGNIVKSDYDSQDRVISKKANGVEIAHYTYDASGNLGLLEDKVNNISYKYSYDLADRLTKITDSKGNVYKNMYDKNNNMSGCREVVNGKTIETDYDYDKDNKISLVSLNFLYEYMRYDYDDLSRVSSEILKYGDSTYYVTKFDYLSGKDGSSTTRIGSIDNNGNKISYTYDALGNISTTTQAGITIKYTYNELNEVTREDNGMLNKSIVYAYDAGGNITSKTEYPYTTGALGAATNTISYGYGDTNWKDKLTSYNGKNITYDAIG
ncbi:DNRLRE domain-containing protein, partial [Clostridium guangxiense]|uniref:DNRLRE domain-containing protein n=1 Tax=Clostridium guangxiense TaxID=1662055 RepID=UPI001E289459